MTNTLGSVTLPSVLEYSFDGKYVTVEGLAKTKSALDDIRALFRHVAAARVLVLVGGKEVYEDLTETLENVQLGAFDAAEAYDGWYLLRGFSYVPESGGYYFFTLRLWFIETVDVEAESLGTGDGSTTVFSATYTPMMYKAGVAVYLDEVEQSSDTYTVDYEAGTITFDTAPSNGVDVTIDYTYLIE